MRPQPRLRRRTLAALAIDHQQRDRDRDRGDAGDRERHPALEGVVAPLAMPEGVDVLAAAIASDRPLVERDQTDPGPRRRDPDHERGPADRRERTPGGGATTGTDTAPSSAAIVSAAPSVRRIRRRWAT